MARSDPDADDGPTDPRTIRDLLSYRIHQLANALSRGAALRYRQEFDVSLMEWRILALLGDFAPLTLTDLARQGGLDKGLASRAVSGLVERGLVRRGTSRHDARELALSLTAPGRKVFRGLIRAACERDDAFLGALDGEEKDVIDRVIRKLLAVARAQMLEDDTVKAPPTCPPRSEQAE
ncbi:MarR family transcriptional regulator [Roseomonas sp. OT10]|uniref:MarR family winged helix-turn-helix transcriptional regulator n=1 Tax=Roseomonas cutis TaxID=2897332 RepID=UPI001E500940|nr:MarR family transcriptional regulator [Roseomonas sp. OT10]UFN47906.1 MarR family transcriptional regulator [Roseomonas sp. OT10]